MAERTPELAEKYKSVWGKYPKWYTPEKPRPNMGQKEAIDILNRADKGQKVNEHTRALAQRIVHGKDAAPKSRTDKVAEWQKKVSQYNDAIENTEGQYKYYQNLADSLNGIALKKKKADDDEFDERVAGQEAETEARYANERAYQQLLYLQALKKMQSNAQDSLHVSVFGRPAPPLDEGAQLLDQRNAVTPPDAAAVFQKPLPRRAPAQVSDDYKKVMERLGIE